MRYLVLVLLNIPFVLLAFLNIITRYKLKKLSTQRFRQQLFIWLIIFAVIVASFPLYNYVNGRKLFDSTDLSAFDIVQTTAIVGLLYVVNTLRQKTEETEKRLRDLHQELSIKLSEK